MSIDTEYTLDDLLEYIEEEAEMPLTPAQEDELWNRYLESRYSPPLEDEEPACDCEADGVEGDYCEDCGECQGCYNCDCEPEEYY